MYRGAVVILSSFHLKELQGPAEKPDDFLVTIK
jgi:hypothetical protein